MIQHYIIRSTVSPKVLCEFRTDGNKMEYLVDNTDGNIVHLLGNDFEQAKDKIKNSSHIVMEQPKNKTLGYFRYLLDNGDVVEITTDGQTCLINGTMVDEGAKQAMMEAIISGKVTVKNKANLNSPTIVPPYRRSVPQRQVPKPDEGVKEALTQSKELAKISLEDDENDHNFDRRLERISRTNSDSPDFDKMLAYYMVHGKFKGAR